MTCLASKATQLAKDPQRHGVVLIQLVKERGFLQHLFVLGAFSAHEGLLAILFSFAFICVGIDLSIEATSKKNPPRFSKLQAFGGFSLTSKKKKKKKGQ